MKQSSNYTFSQVPKAELPRSTFVRNHGLKTTLNAGYLVPIYVDEALPGDTFNVKASLFGRLATPIVPILDNLYMDVFFFAVPNRLLWSNWQKFCGEQLNPGDSTDYLVPVVNIPGGPAFVQSIFDYMGLPNPPAGSLTASALFLRAYNLIWNEWFRDENLQTRRPQNTGDGPDADTDYVLQRRGKRHDYFTSCLPWPQKGVGATIPISSGFVPVVPVSAGVSKPDWKVGANQNAGHLYSDAGSGTNSAIRIEYNAGTLPAAGTQLTWNTSTGLQADLSQAQAATINSLRQAFQIQRLLERDARGGTRYVELLKAHFGVTSPDARLQRPEYLGGGTVNITINPVQQTSASDAATTPQGNLAGYGVAGHSGHGFTKSFVEHSIVLGFVSVRADMSYQYGLNRMWSRRSRYDFYWPALAHLGEQAVLNKEIFLSGTPATNELVFGYQERWAEYRYHPSQITGLFRSGVTGSIDIWHLAQAYAATPALNAAFIEEHPPLDRIEAVPSQPDILLDAFFNLTTARPMPTYSVPGLIDHF